MIEAAAEHGYDAVTVRELCALAGVSTRTFYEHFAGKQRCLASTYDAVMRHFARNVFLAHKTEHERRTQLRSALHAFACELTHDPKAARLALVEAYAGGPAMLERMRCGGAVFEAMIGHSLALHRSHPTAARLVPKAVLGGVVHVAHARLLTNDEHDLPELLEELGDWAVCFECPPASLLKDMSATGGCAGTNSLVAPLPPTDAHVGQNERERILQAVAQLAAHQGFARLSVPHIRSAAGVSRKTFDEYFRDATECFLAAYETLTIEAFHRAKTAAASLSTAATGDEWPARLQCAFQALTRLLASDPILAQVAFVQIYAAGRPALHTRLRIIDRIAAELYAGAGPTEHPGRAIAEAGAGALWAISEHCLASGRAHELPRMSRMLAFLILAPAIGRSGAVRTVTRGRTAG